MTEKETCNRPLIVAWGGGVNSTALVLGMYERVQRPDLILFADTGGEKPETYHYRDVFSAWLQRAGFPPLLVVQNDGKYRQLEKECLEIKSLPSLAYGWHKCSEKYKIRPQDKFVKNWLPAQECWNRGQKVLKAIGFDAGETRRVYGTPDSDKTASTTKKGGELWQMHCWYKSNVWNRSAKSSVPIRKRGLAHPIVSLDKIDAALETFDEIDADTEGSEEENCV